MRQTTGNRQKSKIKRAALLFFSLAFCSLPFAFAQDELWRAATSPYSFDRAKDEASHPDYRLEQWSYSGSLSASDGRKFGYQFKFIRAGVSFKPENPSRWAVRDLLITQLAVTDVDGRQFKTAERLNRAGVGWAGASAENLHLWNDDWEARHDKDQTLLNAEENGLGLHLALEGGRPLISHGEDGVFQKGVLAFNASHLYSLTRMPTRGALLLDGQRIEVTGSSWLDHEFGASMLEEGQRGWDWFTMELDDGTDLMIYQLRLADGTRDEYSIATLVRADGTQEPIRADEVELEPSLRWTSPASGGSYPIRWRVKIPSRQIALDVRAAVEDQELRADQSIGVTYWRGMIVVGGTRNGVVVKGQGNLEMTGYTNPGASVISK